MGQRRRIQKLKALLKHFAIRTTITMSRIDEHRVGLQKFVQWLPRLISSAVAGRFRPRPETSGFISQEEKHRTAFFINLASRGDRKQETLDEFERLSLPKPKRFPAVANKHGGLGCATSHRDLIQLLISLNAGTTMICEDDVEFRGNREEIDAAIEEFEKIPGLGVLCLAYRARGPRLPITRKLAVANNIQMASCYVVKPFAFEALRESFQSSVAGLEDGQPWSRFANDQLWKHVQTHQVFFCIPRIPLAWQRESFSDIVGQNKVYD